MPRVHALGKVDELLEKAHWWMTGEIDRDEERRGKKLPNQQKEEREKLHSGIIYALLLSFLFWHGGNWWVEKMKVSCVIAFSLSHYHQSEPCFFWFFSSFLSGVGISNHSMIMPVPPFLSHNPFMGSFPFFPFARFFRGRGWPGHTSTVGQPIASPTFISLSCLMLKNFHTGELCQIA